MIPARPTQTLPRTSFSCWLALLTGIGVAVAQDKSANDSKHIADSIMQLCVADSGVRVKTEIVGGNLVVRSIDAEGDLRGEFRIAESISFGVYTSIERALRQADADRVDGLRVCLGSLPMQLASRVPVPIALSSPPSPPPSPPALTPARSYFRAVDIPPLGVGAYGVIALRSKPTSASRTRLLKVCSSFSNHLPRTEALPASVPLARQMITIWPLDDPSAPEAKADDCKFMIEHYDLYGGLSAIQDAKHQGAKLDGRGPFLIGWSPASSRGLPDKLVLVVDLSPFESQDSFDSAFLFWQQKIVENPMLWRSGFSIEGIRLAIRDFVDHYGQDVMKATRLWGIKIR